ncbi:unnamed protein product, partial [Polarella glacialis]
VACLHQLLEDLYGLPIARQVLSYGADSTLLSDPKQVLGLGKDGVLQLRMLMPVDDVPEDRSEAVFSRSSRGSEPPAERCSVWVVLPCTSARSERRLFLENLVASTRASLVLQTALLKFVVDGAEGPFCLEHAGELLPGWCTLAALGMTSPQAKPGPAVLLLRLAGFGSENVAAPSTLTRF